MKRFYFALILTIGVFTLTAQDIDEFQWFGEDYEDGLYLSIGVNRVGISNNDAPNPGKHKLTASTFKLDLKDINFERGEASYYFENKLLGDMVYYWSQVFSGEDDIYRDEESGLSSGLIGWHTGLWNITEPKKYQISVGANFSDFFLTASYVKDETKEFSSTNGVILEPNGNYYAVGPSAGFRYLFNKWVMANYRFNMSIPFGRIESDDLEDYDGKYKNPYFFNHSVEVISSKGLFVGYEFTGIMNRGDLPNNTKRKELYLGLRIKIG